MAASFHTPRQRGLPTPRPSYGGSPSLSASTSAAVSTNRNASLRALNGGGNDPKTPAGRSDGGDLEVGDAVNVPGEMYGVVRFIGAVKGKNGIFVGVELDPSFASKGKNDGDVDGTRYFHTSIPGSGIFLPSHRAEKRLSPSAAHDAFAGSPDSPSLNARGAPKNITPPTPALPSKFSQTVGHGARPASPNFKPKRPSIPRPESPFRKPAPNLVPTPARGFSQSQIGGVSSKTPAKSTTNFKASTTGRPSMSGHTPRPYSRSSSRMGGPNIDDDRTPVGTASSINGRTTSSGSVPSFSQPLRSPSRLGSAGGQDQEIQRLRRELSERDRRLDEQAASLAEMEQSVRELSGLLPTDAPPVGGEELSASKLRQIVREKNEKISLLTAEFDAHRADFRSTLDSLELASTETERVYEEQKRDLVAQLAELQDVKQSKEDFEGVASQLKQLEDLVAELEEGLEESRRGEAEARGEVEFLRGEVERGRSELRRERDKAAASVKRGSGGSAGDRSSTIVKEMAKKDDEIRGLKAIIHGLSSTGGDETISTLSNGSANPEVASLLKQLEDNRREKEALEEEVEHLRREVAATNGNGHIGHVRNESELTATGPQRTTSGRARGDTVMLANPPLSHPPPASSPVKPITPSVTETETTQDTPTNYCEMCESAEHDTLDCNSLQPGGDKKSQQQAETMYSPGKENEHAMINGKASSAAVEDKWCALCEQDGHLAFDCPQEQF